MKMMSSVFLCMFAVVLNCHTGQAMRYGFIVDVGGGFLSAYQENREDVSALAESLLNIYRPFRGSIRDPSVACETACGSNSVCSVVNELLFECDCEEGNFVEVSNSTSYTCKDVDECETSTTLCVANADCLNTPGTYVCSCHDGFMGDGRTDGSECTDIDECAGGDEEDLCPGMSFCENHIGGFGCICPDGYDYDYYGEGCQDIDECATGESMCDSNADCINTIGDHECECHEGFEGDARADGSGCTDINECALSPDLCHDDSACSNNEGSFECECLEGFMGDGFTHGTGCTDLDECLLEEMCVGEAECVNTAGSFQCICPEGYEGDGLLGGSGCTVVTTTEPETVTPSVERAARSHYMLWLRRNGNFARSLDIKVYKKLSPYPVEFLDGRRHFADQCL